jgi:methylated-DNA-[protein]-cysteine S-methyltransferase
MTEKKNKISIQYFKTPLGELILGSYEDRLCLCDWQYRRMRDAIDDRIQKGLNAYYQEEETDVIQTASQQLNEYLDGERMVFEIPLKMVGSPFQQSVWDELLNIPYGKTKSYMEISRMVSNEKAIRAVAAANGANAVSIIIPCHRVVGSNGELTGYAGGIQVKKKLLQLEKSGKYPEQLELFKEI